MTPRQKKENQERGGKGKRSGRSTAKANEKNSTRRKAGKKAQGGVKGEKREAVLSAKPAKAGKVERVSSGGTKKKQDGRTPVTKNMKPVVERGADVESEGKTEKKKTGKVAEKGLETGTGGPTMSGDIVAGVDSVVSLAVRLAEAGRADSASLLEAMEQLGLGMLEGMAAAVEAVELIRHRGRYDYLLEQAGVELPGEDDLKSRFFMRLLVHRTLAARQGAAPPLPDDIEESTRKALNKIAVERDWTEEYPDRAKNTVSYLAARYSLPHWFAAELLAQYGLMKAEMIGSGCFKEPRQALAVNLARTDVNGLRESLLREGVPVEFGRYSEDTLVSSKDVDLRSTKAYRDGLFEVVGEVEQILSQLATGRGQTSVILIKNGRSSLVDSALACRLGGKGKLTVLTTDPGESLAVKKRAMRLGSLMVRVMEMRNGEMPDLERVGRADAVVVEAPSSDTGNVYIDPMALWRTRPEDLEVIGKMQLALLEQASRLVASKGKLIYVTRSVMYRENQGVVASFLEANPRFARVSARHLGSNLGEFETQEDFLLILPGQADMTGAFAAVLELEW